MRKFYIVYADVGNYYRDQIVLSKVSCLMDYTYLTAKDEEGQLPPEAKGNHLLYVVEKYQEFEANLKANGIDYVELPVDEEEYNRIYEEKYGKTQSLQEKVEFRGNNYKIIIRSDEDTNHFTPHCHVEFSDGSTASVSIDDNYTIFAMSGKAKMSDYKKPVEMIKKNVQDLRKEWNVFSKSTYKFKLVNGQYVL